MHQVVSVSSNQQPDAQTCNGSDQSRCTRAENASGDQNPIHQNEEFALSVGLPNVIAHGMLTMALTGKYVTDWAGNTAAMKEFSARFIKPVIVPAGEKVDLTVSAIVVEIDGNRLKLDLSATSAGVKVLGMAKAVVEK
jgi:acyl dehydratase